MMKVLIACLVIIYNWFPHGIRNFMVAIWQAAYLICPIITSLKDY